MNYTAHESTELHSDVSTQTVSNISERALDGSGMAGIAVPLNLDLADLGVQTQFGHAEATVNTVDGEIKGIHMSRLYLSLSETLEAQLFSIETVENVLKAFKESHKDISNFANLDIGFNWPSKRPSLTSGHSGWRLYPVKISSSIDKYDTLRHRLEISISYGSFCPCSASLARQVIQKNFESSFGDSEKLTKEEIYNWLGKETSISAIPHGQRSVAKISFNLVENTPLDIPYLIDYLEKAIKTPVQTAVKRVDEKEFAKICGENLMFVEDAVKIFYRALTKLPGTDRVKVEVAHHESLHAHDAVAVINDF